MVQAFGPLRPSPKGGTRFPGTMLATLTGKAPHMQHQHDRMLQDGQVADAPRSALLHLRAARLASATHDGRGAAFEMHLQLLGGKHLIDDAKFWEIEQRFDPMKIRQHGFLRLGGWIPRIVRGILCLSMSASEPLVIGPRHWPQTWRRARRLS